MASYRGIILRSWCDCKERDQAKAPLLQQEIFLRKVSFGAKAGLEVIPAPTGTSFLGR
jgi:hypothetical protein